MVRGVCVWGGGGDRYLGAGTGVNPLGLVGNLPQGYGRGGGGGLVIKTC